MRKYVIGFIVGALVFGGIGVAAAILSGEQVEFSPDNTNWQVSNVEDALNSLYASRVSTNYSEDETIVGTWTDGKPVYQKTIVINAPASGNAYGKHTTYSEKDIGAQIKTVINIDGTFAMTNNNIVDLNSEYSQTEWNIVWITNNGHSAPNKVRLAVGTSTPYPNGTAIVTIQYLKTTD